MDPRTSLLRPSNDRNSHILRWFRYSNRQHPNNLHEGSNRSEDVTNNPKMIISILKYRYIINIITESGSGPSSQRPCRDWESWIYVS